MTQLVIRAYSGVDAKEEALPSSAMVLTCRERHVRRDTSRPVCQNCNRLSRKRRWPFPEPEQIDTKLRNSRLLDLELMHHYTAYTYVTISRDLKLIVLWKMLSQSMPSGTNLSLKVFSLYQLVTKRTVILGLRDIYCLR